MLSPPAGVDLSSLMGTCINFADSFAVREKSFGGLTTFFEGTVADAEQMLRIKTNSIPTPDPVS